MARPQAWDGQGIALSTLAFSSAHWNFRQFHRRFPHPWLVNCASGVLPAFGPRGAAPVAETATNAEDTRDLHWSGHAWPVVRRGNVPDGPITLGRHRDCDVVFPAPTVSQVHAHVRRHAGEWELVDLRSRNGTRLNGRPVPIGFAKRLPDLAELRIGHAHPVLWCLPSSVHRCSPWSHGNRAGASSTARTSTPRD